MLTEGRRGQRRPAEELANAAMRHFGLRYLAAFGPGVPDGVISLDAMALERGVTEPAASRGLVTFAGGDPGRPVYRTAEALAAAIDAHLEAAPLTADERILTLLPAHDLRGLVTGLGAALAAGAGLETVIPFDEAGFRAALLRPVPTRLVVPALIEPALAALPLPWTVRALDVVHRAPTNLSPRGARPPPARGDSIRWSSAKMRCSRAPACVISPPPWPIRSARPCPATSWPSRAAPTEASPIADRPARRPPAPGRDSGDGRPGMAQRRLAAAPGRRDGHRRRGCLNGGRSAVHPALRRGR
ncbi:hypothetical protein ACU4GR_12925 [Methylobacterium oryzae CBMB20]